MVWAALRRCPFLSVFEVKKRRHSARPKPWPNLLGEAAVLGHGQGEEHRGPVQGVAGSHAMPELGVTGGPQGHLGLRDAHGLKSIPRADSFDSSLVLRNQCVGLFLDFLDRMLYLNQ